MAKAEVSDATDELNLSLLDAFFCISPRSDAASAWHGHVPFAFWVVSALRPKLIVELGTHNGVSYSAFCESVIEQKLDTKCYAVDTWLGDAHAGFYPEQVYDDLRQFHDARYNGFSTMLRTTFDDALAYFGDGTIDLLHIDGCHGYDEVRHDFESWLPKLSRRAVVLFHDTNVRERHFGVWKLWLELCQEYPNFEFIHEHGLGVLGVGPDLDGPLSMLFRLDDPSAVATIQRRFYLSGPIGRVRGEQFRLQQDLDALQRRLQEVEASYQAVEASKITLIAEHQIALDIAQAEASRLDIIATANEARAANVRRDLAQTHQHLAETSHALDTSQHQVAFKDLEIAHLRGFAEQYHALVGSAVWRATRPLRSAGNTIPLWFRRGLKRVVRAGWSIVSVRSSHLAQTRRNDALADLQPSAPELLPDPVPPPFDRFSLDQIARPDIDLIPVIKYYDPIAPEVSIIVLNWNGGDMTLLCLQHLWRNTTGHHYEIIVVDNGSDPADTQKLREQMPYLKLVELGANRYFGEANNIGVEASRGRLICFLNNDAFVAPGWLEALTRALSAEPDVAAVGPLFVYPNGDLQEAGAMINADGTATQLGKGSPVDDPAFRTRRIVDYVSAACMLMRRDDFIRVLGFDLAWDPAYYEDADLCLKLNLLGLKTVYCPDTTVIHIESATSTHRGASLKLGNIVAINRTKFLGRWGRYRETAGQERPAMFYDRPVAMVPLAPKTPRLRVLIFTPYALTPGGGERYILTIAVALRDIAHVALATPLPVSRIRLLTMGREFGLDLDQVELIGPDEIADRPLADLAFVLGNEIFPTVGRLGVQNVFMCQFPFPFPTEAMAERQKPFWADVDLVLTNSEYVRAHVEHSARAWGVPACPIEVLHPPVPMVAARTVKQPGKLLNVGRFFVGGHCKRQDRMIEAFRLLIDQGVQAELHLAGSTMPEWQHRAYYSGLIEQAKGLPVFFYTNVSTEALHQLYASSDIYWHATGLGADVEAEPHVVEHFGISVVEAMSARCIPVVFGFGGPVTIVDDGVTGLHYLTVEELAAKTRMLLETTPEADKEAMRDAAADAAPAYDEANFQRRVRGLADRLVGAERASEEIMVTELGAS